MVLTTFPAAELDEQTRSSGLLSAGAAALNALARQSEHHARIISSGELVTVVLGWLQVEKVNDAVMTPVCSLLAELLRTQPSVLEEFLAGDIGVALCLDALRPGRQIDGLCSVMQCLLFAVASTDEVVGKRARGQVLRAEGLTHILGAVSAVSDTTSSGSSESNRNALIGFQTTACQVVYYLLSDDSQEQWIKPILLVLAKLLACAQATGALAAGLAKAVAAVQLAMLGNTETMKGTYNNIYID